MVSQEKAVMDAAKVKRALTRIAHQILEKNGGAEHLAIIGILTRGAHLAKRIAKLIEEIEGTKVPVGLMDINLYRDDVHSTLDQPIVQRTDIIFSVEGRHIVLVDDVLFTGRTIRAALDQIIDFGRPHSIQLAVLIDRGHRELPISPDYVGSKLATSRSDRVVLEVEEKEGADRVYVTNRPKPSRKPSTEKAATSSGTKRPTKKTTGSKRTTTKRSKS